MTALIVIVLAVVIASGISLFKIMTSSKTAVEVPKKPFMTVEEAENLVDQLAVKGYYKYADPKDLDKLREELVSSFAEYGVLSTVYCEKTFDSLDRRLYSLDGETLFEQGGFMEAIKSMRPLFSKMDLQFDITNHIEDAENGWLDHQVTINGKPYIIFAYFDAYGWGEAAQRFAEIMNDQLQLQNKDERLYLINGGNDGTAIYLTHEQFDLLDKALTDQYWKPLPVDRWCTVFEVDPTNYNKNSLPQ